MECCDHSQQPQQNQRSTANDGKGQVDISRVLLDLTASLLTHTEQNRSIASFIDQFNTLLNHPTLQSQHVCLQI
ncbi:MAG TPA: hypothetical protein VIH42_00605 [Thermoguttaceae bacterium]